MPHKIYKYVLDDAKQDWEFDLPVDAKILDIQVQFRYPCIWVLLDTEAVTVKRTFKLYGTGQPVNEPPEKLHYIGTYQMASGAYIFHLFEIY